MRQAGERAAAAGWLAKAGAALTGETPSPLAAGALIAAWTALWIVYRIVSQSLTDLHFDMTEAYVWSRHFAWSYPKHPPMLGWITGLWFSVFPRSDWAFHALASVNVGLTHFIVWRLAEDFLVPGKRLLALAVVSFVPLVTFLAANYNANAVLLPFWALTTLFFLRSLNTGAPHWAALAGLAAAGAFLGKYYSVFLFAGLGLAALRHPERGRYFRSAAPWITIGVGLLAIAPHLAWLAGHDYTPLTYAADTHSGNLARAASAMLRTLTSTAGYATAGLLLLWLAARPDLARLPLALAGDRQHRVLQVAFLGQLLLAVPALVALGKTPASAWTMPAWSLFGVVLAAPEQVRVTPTARRRALGALLGLPAVMVLASPLLAIYELYDPIRGDPGFVSRLAPAVESAWRNLRAGDLAYVGGSQPLADGVAFYATRPLESFPGLSVAMAPWIDPADVDRRGIAVVCQQRDAACRSRAEALAAGRTGTRRESLTLSRSDFGVERRSNPIDLFILPPRG